MIERLKRQVGEILTLVKVSDTVGQFKKLIDRRLPQAGEQLSLVDNYWIGEEFQMAVPENATNMSKDWSRHRASWFFWWGLPILAAISTNILKLSITEMAFVLSIIFAWAGTGCLLNARRCSRVHCFFMGPALWLGAIAAALVGVGMIADAQALSYVVWGTVTLVLLSKVPEAIWGKYTRRI